MGYFHSPLHLLVLQDAAPARSPHSGLSGSKVRTASSREFTQPRLPKSTRPLEARGKALHGRNDPLPPILPYNDIVAVEKPKKEEETEENKEGDHAREIAHRFRPCFAGSLSCPLPLPVSCPSRKQACSHHSTDRSLCRSPPLCWDNIVRDVNLGLQRGKAVLSHRPFLPPSRSFHSSPPSRME